jgi:hypothetical protein
MTKRRIRAQLKTEAHRWPVLNGNLSELAISLKTVRAFAPFVHTIWVVTQRPHRIDDPGVTFVHHDEILQKENLPTFNSKSIESGIHNIPGLAEHFIYMNDDFFIGDTITPGDMFADGRPIMRSDNPIHNAFKQYRIFNNTSGGGPSIPRMRKLMGGRIFGTNHQIHPMTRSLMRDTETAYRDAWKQTQASPFRDDKNIPPVTMAYNYGLRHKGVHVLEHDRLTSMQVRMKNFKNLVKNKPSLFCLHDVTTPEHLEKLNQFVDALIKERGTLSVARDHVGNPRAL